MTNTIKNILLTLVALTAVVLAQPGSLVGSWVDSRDTQWTFRADGSGFMECGSPKTTARFNWQLQGQTLQVSTAGTSVPYQVVQFDGQNLVIRNQRSSQSYQLRRGGKS